MNRSLAAVALVFLVACGEEGPPGEMTLPHCSGGVHEFAPSSGQGPPNTPLDALVEHIEAQREYPDDPSRYDELREGDEAVLYHHDSEHKQIRILIQDLSDGRGVWAVTEERICRDEPPPFREP